MPARWPRSPNQPFYLDLFRRIMIFAIAAVSLDLILGYGGMVSFGHAAYLGIGAYAVGIPAFHGIAQRLRAVAAGDRRSRRWSALVIGAISLRTSGVYFIMITLAFAQMLYYLGICLEPYGGDDGMRLARAQPVRRARRPRRPATSSTTSCSASWSLLLLARPPAGRTRASAW